MKGLICYACMDFRALSPKGPVTCECGNLTGWWEDPSRGIAVYFAYDRNVAYGMGVHNGYLTGAHRLHGMAMDQDWRDLHEQCTDAPNYLFDQSRRGCWALIFKPGLTNDTSWADKVPDG
jgi:hypothetical protein